MLRFLSGGFIVHILLIQKIFKCVVIIESNKIMNQGWGFSNDNNVRMQTNQVVEKKKEAFWEVANQNVIVVPDIDAETEAIQADVSNPMGLEAQKLIEFYDLQIQTRKSTLPAPEQGVDLSLLLSMIRTGDQLQQKDEPWQFSKLKTQVYQLVSKLNKQL